MSDEAHANPHKRCETCGLPLVECSGVALARKNLEHYLRDWGYSGLRARERADALVPECTYRRT